MDTVLLREFIAESMPFENAEKGFWKYIATWREDDPGDFFDAFRTMNISSLHLKKEKIALVIHYRFEDPVEFVTTTLNVMLNGRAVAYYHYLQKLDGEVKDDVLEFFK